MLIYYVEVSFNFHLTFLEVNVIKMSTVQEKLFFFSVSGYFLLAPDNMNLFPFPLKVRVIQSQLYY